MANGYKLDGPADCIFTIDDPQAQEAVRQTFHLQFCPRQHVLIRQGEIPNNVYVLLRGIMRGYVQGAKGQDVTECIIYRCGEPAMPNSNLHIPALSNIEALSDCELAYAPVPQVERLVDKYAALQNIYRDMLCMAAEQHLEIHSVICQYDAMGRYLWFLERYPGLIHRVPNKYVASYLNITPVTLSRVRRKLKEQAGGDFLRQEE